MPQQISSNIVPRIIPIKKKEDKKNQKETIQSPISFDPEITLFKDTNKETPTHTYKPPNKK